MLASSADQKETAASTDKGCRDTITSRLDLPGNHGDMSKAGGAASQPAEVQSEKMVRKRKKKYYVLFVGNLPYDVTKEDLQEHFKRTGTMKPVLAFCVRNATSVFPLS